MIQVNVFNLIQAPRKFTYLCIYLTNNVSQHLCASAVFRDKVGPLVESASTCGDTG